VPVQSRVLVPRVPSDGSAALASSLAPAGTSGTWLLPQKVEPMSPPVQLEPIPLLIGGLAAWCGGGGWELGGHGSAPGPSAMLCQSCAYISFSSPSTSPNHAAVSSPVRPLALWPAQGRFAGGGGLGCVCGCATTPPLCHSSSTRSLSALRMPLDQSMLEGIKKGGESRLVGEKEIFTREASCSPPISHCRPCHDLGKIHKLHEREHSSYPL
jgi:hypothetical protein